MDRASKPSSANLPGRLLDWLRGVLERHPRERWRAFASFLWHRFVDHRCFESAGALSYTTVFALVPLTAAAFGVVAAFPSFQVWLDQSTDFIFANFVPASARAVEKYLREFADSARGLTSIGGGALLVSALLTMASIEDTFNRIWRVEAPRSKLARFLVYWVALTLGPLLVIASLAISSYLFSLPFISDAAQKFGLQEWLLGQVPTVVELSAFTAGYLVIPNRSVRFRYALVGGVLATLLFELAKFGLATYISNVPSYTQVYGTLAVIPIFLIWIYLSWVSVLLGASFAASLSAFRWQPLEQRLPVGHEMYGLLRLLARFAMAQRAGVGLHSNELPMMEPSLTDDLLQRYLALLEREKVVQRNEFGEWVLVRDLNCVRLEDLYRSGNLRVPVARLTMPFADDDIGRCAVEALNRLRDPLSEGLQRTLGDVFQSLPSDPSFADELETG